MTHGLDQATVRAVEVLGDQQRFVTRSGSVIVLDRSSKRAIRVLGSSPETRTRETFAALGWRWRDRAAGEEIE